MDNKKLEWSDATLFLSQAWEKGIRDNILFLLASFVVAVILFIVYATLVNVFQNDGFVMAILMLLYYVALLVISAEYINIFLKIARGEKLTINTYKPLYQTHSNYIGMLLNYLGTVILYGFIQFGGFILLVVPGIIWTYKYLFSPFIVIDKDSDPFKALAESGRITKGNKWKMFWFIVLFSLIGFAGIILFGLGLLITLPIVYTAMAIMYVTLADASRPIQQTVPQAAPEAMSAPDQNGAPVA